MLLSLPIAVSWVVLAAALTNRILAMAAGLWFNVPAGFLLSLLLFIDVIQIPFFYRLYERGFSLAESLPIVGRFLSHQTSTPSLRKWAAPFGGVGVMLVAAMPTFGGGMWSATFLAHGLKLERSKGYAWMILGSVLSYCTLYWVLSALIQTVRYFIR